jgi:hypothetical protein
MKIKTEYPSVFVTLNSIQICIRTSKYIYRSCGLNARSSFSSDIDISKVLYIKRKVK